LTVFQQVRSARPDANFVYVADDDGFPYGNLEEDRLIKRVIEVAGRAISDSNPDLVVVACNTASTLALGELRTHFRLPFVGTVPAIKPACAQSATKCVAVLGTQATVGREYTHALIREFGAGCDVHLIGSARLAAFAEAELAGAPVADKAIAGEIARCFIDKDGRRTDTIVLACTHYPLLLDRFRANARWPVTWLDPAPAIARRVADLMRIQPNGKPPASPRIVFTSGRAPSPQLAASVARYGF
jgi:glutamate racemase